MSVTISAKKRCSGSSLPPAVCRMAYVVFTYLCLLAYSGVQHILCCSFACLRLVSCVSNVASFSGMSFLDCSFGLLTSILCYTCMTSGVIIG